jgi:PAS domain S-box-containing protein
MESFEIASKTVTDNHMRKEDSYYRDFLDSIDEGFCIIEMIFDSNQKAVDYRFINVNPAFEKHTGLINAAGKTVKEMIPLHDDHWFETYGIVALTRQPLRFQNYAEQLGRYYNVYAYPFGRPEDNQLAVLFSDVSAQKKAENELLKNEARFRQTLDNLQEGCAILGYDWSYLYVNDNNAKHAHRTRDELLGKKITDAIPGVAKSKFYEGYKRCMEERKYQHIEDSFTFEDGHTEWFESFAHPVPEGIFVLSMNVTERKLSEINLKQALQDKDILLKEVYHRTKNNMQVISSLLNLKGSRITNDVYRNDFFEMKSRIHAMALVHDMLYQTRSLSKLDLGSYIENLVNLLTISHSDKMQRVNVTYNVCNYEVSIDTAIPCGIIITELVINVFKYAFPEERRGNLNVELSRSANSKIKLIIADDGIGIHEEEIFNEEKLGTQLVRSLVEDQLNGELKVETSPDGTSWSIIFG